MARIAGVVDLLGHLSASSRRPLANPGFAGVVRVGEAGRFDRVMAHVQSHLGGEIWLDDAARLAALTPEAFCRFFKRATGRTLTTYVNELRFGEACRQLVETEATVSGIRFRCGFNSLSHFHAQFVRQRRMPPGEFRRRSGVI